MYNVTLLRICETIVIVERQQSILCFFSHYPLNVLITHLVVNLEYEM